MSDKKVRGLIINYSFVESEKTADNFCILQMIILRKNVVLVVALSRKIIVALEPFKNCQHKQSRQHLQTSDIFWWEMFKLEIVKVKNET